MNTLWHIVPSNDGYTYLCVDENKKYILKEKTEGLMLKGKLVFNTQKDAQDFIDNNLEAKTYKVEKIWVNKDFCVDKNIII